MKTAARTACRHIMVINDTVAILDLFRSLLEEEGYQVTTDGFSVEGGELLQRVQAVAPDLIVLDLIIQQEERGWQFLQLLKMDRTTQTIPIVVCTAAAKLVEELQVHLDTMGVRTVLKPFAIDAVLDALGQLLPDVSGGEAHDGAERGR